MQAPLPSHTLPFEQGVEMATDATLHCELPSHVRVAQTSEVQAMGVPTHEPSPSQWSLYVQALPSLQPVVEFEYVTEQLAVPLHCRILHASDEQVIGVPAQSPAPSQWSP